MKTKFLSFLVFCAVLLGACAPNSQRVSDCMGLDLSASVGQEILFSPMPAAIRSLQNKTIMMWVYLDGVGANHYYFRTGTTGAVPESFILSDNGAGKLVFSAHWSISDGQWTTNAAISTGVLHLIAVTYGNSSTANDPIIYVDGSPVAFTENFTPSGSYVTGLADLHLGGAAAPISDASVDGRDFTFLIYDRILSASEILDAWNSHLLIPNYNGLVFAPNLCGAGGVQVFGGATLAAGNKITDLITGEMGTPSGSPLGVLDTVLNMGQ